MGETALVVEWMDAGKELVEALDRENFDVVAAMWLRKSEDDDWRLILATPEVAKNGPRSTYKKLQQLLEKVGAKIPLSDITVMDPQEQLIKSFRSAISTGPGVKGIRFSGNAIDRVFIEDAYIYRVA